MGNICSSTTKQQVTANLESSLKPRAKSLLANDFQQKLPNDASLESYLEAIARAGFNKEFGYEWSLENCSPRNTLGIVKPVTDYCIVDQDHDLADAIKSYVDADEGGADLQPWMKLKATADLATFISECADGPCDNNWYYKSRMETYNARDTTMDSYKGDMTIVYTNATRTESAIDITLHIFLFVAVYYSVESPTKEAFGDLQTAAYTAAEKLDNSTVNVNSDVTLTTALHKYSIPNFKSKWGYDYETGQPSDFPKDESDAVYTKNTHLCYFQSKSEVVDDDFLDNYIKQNIMSGLNITIDSARASIQNDIKAIFQEIISDSHSGQWNIEPIDKKYELNKISENPLRMNALVVQWYDSKSLEVGDTDEKKEDVTVEMIYLYFLGVVYELIPDPIYQDLTQKLSKNIPGIDQSSLSSNITPPQFISYVETYNVSRFKHEYSIDFPSTPSSNAEKHWRVFFEFPSWEPSDDVIEEAVTKNLFGSDDKKDLQIKHGKQADVYHFIVDTIKYCSGTDYTKDDDQWNIEAKEDNLSYKFNDVDWILDVRTSCVFANGKMTEDGDGGETVKRFYLSLLLYVTAEIDQDSGSDV